MTDSEFRVAIAELVADWQFWRIVRNFEQTAPAANLPGCGTESPEVSTRLASSGDLLAPRDTASTMQGRGGSETGSV